MNRFITKHLHAIPMLLIVLLVACGAVLAASFQPFRTSSSEAVAQTYGTNVTTCFTGAVTGGSGAVIGTAPGSTHWTILEADIMSTATGSLTLYDGTTSGTVIAILGVAANAPRGIQNIWGSGGYQMTTQTLTAVGPGTLYSTILVKQK
jgi:hypothetical protein